ncbi:MAG: Clp protease ClpP [Ruminococcus sp.]|nr:Clp protease ClpP [Ruminococcus sp.]
MRKFWKFRNSAEDPEARVLELNGTIAEKGWYNDDITPEEFKADLMESSGDITVLINSPGGDCVAASRIYAMLRDYPGKVTVKIDGLAASAASVVAMAGDTVQMVPTALMMIHNPSTVAWGDHVDLERAVSMLDEVKESIINAYEIKTGITRKKLSDMMEEETWMNAKKAVELGFADEETGADGAQAYAFSALSVARNFTNKIAEKAQKPDGVTVSNRKAALYERLLKF